ncbi:BREX-1 system adenine-specific DNA-methyltransferase PglX [Gramella sp. GC03-9]|uniref:site-specific DNA-methyltransferase (adenine-specific) n=1 Tax=Christiangramia oceanisediminis TaxID=2920386 RepID=A0A9X2R9B7_9FLAO|nr:N-6 DNA methylase [Gramella oceanisediminis]MCP9200812.1 BREX-1 system adenine-specific DNA-methyltransferase PglX [Gramella oceanisediminis]
MALFQVSVLKKYLKLQDEKTIDKSYKKFTSYFQHPEIQENIRKSKEEQFQATFLSELFVNILGYKLNPNPNYNLTTEFKNESNNRKADGAILKQGNAIGVIELKGTNTKHLEGIRQQAFDYKANQKNCVYVITSNFEKLRFYINDATEFLEFDLFELNRNDFGLLWLCMHHDHILNGLPLKIKEASLVEEEAITKEFYKDYSVFKRELYRDLVKKNAKELKSIRHSELASESLEDEEFQKEVNGLEKNVKLNLFKKSQKLIDRFLFVFFAEDRGLLPPNSIHKIIQNWEMLQEMDVEQSLYERYKIYFNYLNTGREAKGDQAEIFAYNGGLFKPDTILDMLKIDNDLLLKHTKKLATYDFESQVDVNILGHIFENSLNEIESVNAEIEGADFDKQKSKRKKDGVFYTPKYITKYIVENTVGKLCEEKKIELGFREEEYFKGRKKRHKATLEQLLKILENYREWLLKLTICDPACGSGAFLNQALDFLIKEHRYIDEMRGKLLDESFRFPGIENTILENNIYGVDINEESVEIARLSLWLRTAKPHRKLNDLSSHIKCGNSLIDNKKIAGDKAFKWDKEFPEVFKNGGFDVIIGNPPYGAKLEKPSQQYLNERYIQGGSETVISFLKLSHELLNIHGQLGFIIPKSFSFSSNYRSIREFLIAEISEIVDCGKVWNNVKLEQIIISFTKSKISPVYNSAIRNNTDITSLGIIDKQTFKKYDLILNGISEKELEIGQKIHSNNIFLNDVAINQRGGSIQRNIGPTGDFFVLGGANIQREGIKGYKGMAPKNKINNDSKNLLNRNSVLVQNIVSHINNPIEHIKITACTVDTNLNRYAILDTINQLTINSNKYSNIQIENLLNSPLVNWYAFRFIYGKAIRTMHFDNAVTSRIPLPVFTIQEGKEINSLGIELKKRFKEIFELEEVFDDFIRLSIDLQSHKGIIGNSINDFKKFINKINSILRKNNREKLSKEQELDWFGVFNKKSMEILKLKKEITEIQYSIDNLIFKVYGLNEKEIQIIKDQMP